MIWKTPEDIPIEPFRKSAKGIMHNDLSVNGIEECIDKLIPRGGEKPDQIFVSLEEYLSRISMFYRKVQGVKYRKECWDTIIKNHLDKFNKKDHRRIKNQDEEIIQKNAKMYSSFGLRDIKLENEFEVLIYSICNSLSMLAKLISAFRRGEIDLHSHSKLQNNLNKNNDWPSLSAVVNKACHEWIDDLTMRRDAATHYVALTTISSVTTEIDKSNVKENQRNRVSIPKQPLKYISVWWDNIPVLGGASQSSRSLECNDGNRIEAHCLFDAENNLLVRRNSNLPELPELIDGGEYVESLIKNYENYIKKIASELSRRFG